MRILVLSDLHANAAALDAALDAVKGRWDTSVCLGDVVGYGPDPNEVTTRLRELGTPGGCGTPSNRDRTR